MYEVLDALLLRASIQATDLDLPPWPDLTGQLRCDQVHEWLAAVWSHRPFADATTVASPDLAAQVERILAGQQRDPRQRRRTVAAVGRYLLRITGRSAPFGLFAGVAPASLGVAPAARWGHDHRAVTRPDGAWLAAVIAGLEACAPLLRRLTVVRNLVEVRDDRLILAWRPRPDHDGRDAPATVDVDVRRTPAMASIITHTATPITVAALLDELRREFPTAQPQAVQAAVLDLVRLRILLTALRPPLTETDALSHLLAELAAVHADDIPDVAATVGELRTIANLMTGEPSWAPGHERATRQALTTRMKRLHIGAGQPTAVDLRLDCDVVLPDCLVREAAAAAAALTRLTPFPDGLPAWREYHTAFLDRYGVGAVVPLLDLVDPTVGLGYPATYRGSRRTVTPAGLTERDRGLLRLAQQAIIGDHELLLDDSAIADLADPENPLAVPPPHAELFVQVHADSVTALRGGHYRLVVTGASRAAGATTGRFLHLLDQAEQDRFRVAYTRVATLRADAVLAAVSIPPIADSSNHLASAPRVLPTVVSAGECAIGNDRIRTDDLGVGADTDGLFLVNLRDRRLIEPTAFNAVEFRYFSHPLTRLLCELPRARAAVYMPFSWGAAAGLPTLPRVRYRRTILSPARWNLTAADLPAAGTPWPHWQAALAEWRSRFRTPARVYLVEADNLLPLDLTDDNHQFLLRTHLDKHGHARLDETPPPGAFGWLDGHAHEVVVPLTSTTPPAPDRLPQRLRPVERMDAHVPGNGQILYAKLYTSTNHVLDLVHHVPDLIASGEGFGRWWYLPYADPQPHLRLRIRLASADAYGKVTAQLGAWADRLRAARLISRLQLDTYLPETGRYGHGEAMAAAESVFAADSAAAQEQRRACASATVPHDALTAASFVDLATAFTGSVATAMAWLVAQLPHENAPVDRTTHTAAMRLADPHADWAGLHTADPSGAVRRAWLDRRRALDVYREQLAAQRDPTAVLPSLLHLHSIRVHGIDPNRERVAVRLARAAALRWSALHPTDDR